MHTLQYQQFGKIDAGTPAAASGNVAVVRATPRSRSSGLLLGLVGAAVLTWLVRTRPEFCVEHAIGLAFAVCLALGASVLADRERASRRLVCDGRWLGSASWLVGAVVDLEGLVAVDCGRTRSGRGICELTFRSASRKLLCLDLRQWRQDELRALLARLRRNHPGLSIDVPTRVWLEQPLPGYVTRRLAVVHPDYGRPGMVSLS
ncbi:MAG: hypothetical protein JOY51_06730 [Nevskia sp.]|nr:hypothetical protein [Nevskia sp.]